MTTFLAAVDADVDERAEQLAFQLTADDEVALLALLASPSLDRRWWALRGLALCGAARTVPAVADRLADADSSVRAAALLTLAHLHQRGAAAVTAQL
ncbi:MAG: HEAT repeat domain-containing protein, partial [Caldilinea sp.]